MPKKGGSGSRKSLRVEEKAAQEAEQAAAVVDAQTAAKEAQAAADAAAEELAVYRAEVASAAEAAEQMGCRLGLLLRGCGGEVAAAVRAVRWGIQCVGVFRTNQMPVLNLFGLAC